MARKVSFTKEDIENAALQVVRSNGHESLNARAVAAQLGCSTQPIFSNFSNMQDLMDSVLKRSLEIYNTYVEEEVKSGKHPSPYKAAGMGYIMFAMKEKNLFRLLFMRDRTKETSHVEERTFAEILPQTMESTGLAEDKAARFHLSMWVVVHGIASMIATSYCEWTVELASQVLSDAFLSMKKTIDDGEYR